MKKQILAVLFLGLMSGASYASTACSAGTATEVTGADDKFVRTNFKPKCSANTKVDYTDQTSSIAVAGISVKGGNSFKANSAGGSVLPHEKCTGKVCADSDLSAALTAAEEMKSGS